ncbi:MAG: 16S rRNA (cytidine(1402)-2'-O)-methyltransferase [Patescibacteria group bacterium]
MDCGKLFIVPTPIGNLGDISQRALKVLSEVSVILSEDTRETKKLLDKYNINTSQISYRDQNHSKVLNQILTLLSSGQDAALVSDSGAPLVSDPGFKLISHLRTENYEIISIPGPSAAISALIASGLPTDKFSFLGFLPKSKGKKKEILTSFGSLDSTLIIYESPYRIGRLLLDVEEILGNRFVCIASEISKIHEQYLYGSISDVTKELSNTKVKGEYVLLIAKKGFKHA